MKKEMYFEIIAELDDVLFFLGDIVDKYGNLIGLNMNEDDEKFREGVHHDYVYFCFTKMLRSSCAYNELSKMGFREDCMAIGRCIYETYLHVSNALKNPEFIDIADFQALKLKEGLLKFKRISKGVVELSCSTSKKEKILKHDLRVKSLANNTLVSIDGKIHEKLYAFMSELIHSNFISSGNYRSSNNSKYNVDTNKPQIDVIFTLTYFLFLICEHMEYYHLKFECFEENDLKVLELIEFSRNKEKLRKILININSLIKSNDDIEERIQINLY